jgi:hypothetical protein
MARDHEPMTDEQLSAAREELQSLREEVREALAEDLGGDPDDYRADQAVADGGDE